MKTKELCYSFFGAVVFAVQVFTSVALLSSSTLASQTHSATVVNNRLRFPGDVTTTFKAEEQPFTAWLFYYWSQAGYAVPKNGETFRWGDYALAISDFTKVRTDDCVVYLNNSQLAEAIVIAIDLSDRDKIAVVEPLPGGMVLYHAIERKALQGIARPLKKAKAGKPETLQPLKKEFWF